jgi:hypothetical protein
MKRSPTLGFWILSVWWAAVPAPGQDAPKNSPRPTEAASVKQVTDQTLHVFRLQHTAARHALAAVQEICGQPKAGSGKSSRFAVDERANRLIVYSDPETLRIVADLVMALDKPQDPEQASEPRLKIIELRHVHPLQVVKEIERLSPNGLVAVFGDPRTKTVFVKATQDAFAQVSTLVDRIDAASPAPMPRADLALRIAWLVDKSLTVGEAAAVPHDLSEPIEKLRKQIDLGELRMATQMVITVNPAVVTEFQSAATAKLKQTADLRVSGMVVQGDQGEDQLQLQLTATQQSRPQPICKVHTACSGVFQGHPVVVGMTTVDSLPCVFVIEILPNK